jgi:hypothetical protein
MVSIKKYNHVDHYELERLIKDNYHEKHMMPPTSGMIRDTIAFFTSYPQCGAIYTIKSGDETVGYSIIQNQWKNKYGRIIYFIDELYIDKDWRKDDLEVNFIEHLIKHEKIYAIATQLTKLNKKSRRVFRFFKFARKFDPILVKRLAE